MFFLRLRVELELRAMRLDEIHVGRENYSPGRRHLYPDMISLR